MTEEPHSGAQSLAHWTRLTPHAIAVTEAGERYSYAVLATIVVKVVKHVAASGLAPGSMVAISCSNRSMHLTLILAFECLGMTTMSFPIFNLSRNNELLARCSVLYAEVPCTWRHTVPVTQELITTMMRIPVAETDFALLEVQPNPVSGGRIVQTSGTTGQPKIMWNSPVAIDRMVTANCLTPEQVAVTQNFLCLYPFTVRPTYTHSLLALRFGHTVVFSNIHDFQHDLESIADRHTVLLAAEAATLCAKLPRLLRLGLRCAVQIDGSGVSAALRRRLLETFATSIVNAYSSNELNDVTWVDEDGVGTILPDASVRIIGEDNAEMPIGKTGRITVRTSRMAPGYLWNDALTARHFVDGWYITDDLGFQPTRRQLVVIGRADDMLNVGGIKVPPQPFEAAIRAIDGVIEAVLLGVENDLGLVDLHLVIERTDLGRDADLDRLIRPIVRGCGRDFVVHFRDSLPRTHTGKVQRAALKALIKDPHAD